MDIDFDHQPDNIEIKDQILTPSKDLHFTTSIQSRYQAHVGYGQRRWGQRASTSIKSAFLHVKNKAGGLVASICLTATNSIRFMAMTTSIYFNPKLILSGSIMQRKQINDDFLLVHPSHFPLLLHHLLSRMALTNKPTHHDHKV